MSNRTLKQQPSMTRQDTGTLFCPRCMKPTLQAFGWQFAAGSRYRRFKCLKGCGRITIYPRVRGETPPYLRITSFGNLGGLVNLFEGTSAFPGLKTGVNPDRPHF